MQAQRKAVSLNLMRHKKQIDCSRRAGLFARARRAAGGRLLVIVCALALLGNIPAFGGQRGAPAAGRRQETRSTTRRNDTRPTRDARGQRPPAPATSRAVPDSVMLRLLRAEDERRWDDALAALLTDRNARVRERAALAAGRIGDERAVPALVRLLQDNRDTSAQAMAAFALGETEAATGASALMEALRPASPAVVRGRAVEALGKIAAALTEPEAARKAEIGRAILGALEFEHGRRSRPDRETILLGLTAALRARPENGGAVVARFLTLPDARIRADAANALARMRAREANETLRGLAANDPDPIVRANAARALGAAEDSAAGASLLALAMNDTDERARVSAIRALAALRDARAAAPLLQRGESLFAAYRAAKERSAARPAEANELLEIATTLGRLLANTGDERAVAWLGAFSAAEEREAPEVEIALARIAPAQYARERRAASLADDGSPAEALSWRAVASRAQGLAEIAALTGATGGNSFLNTQVDAQMRVRAMLGDSATPALAVPDVLRALAAFKPDDLANILRARLSAQEVIVRATAAELLGELPPDEATTRALAAALPVAMRDELNDAALAILDALGKQKTGAAIEAIVTAYMSRDHLVRRRAAAALRAAGVPGGISPPMTVTTRNTAEDYRRALARRASEVRALVSTDKGEFTIELLSQDAPLTVDNFVRLARRGYFNGIVFHRVVPNFVIQGGDPRGDGNGGPGYQIRCEINEARYDRGAVGMALSGKDTGGSQWFVTHSPQPHLDGGYTVFGRVVAGMDVVDRIARGDRIRTITITERARPATNRQRAAPRNR